MGHQIVRQPDGRLAVWSTGVDDWVLYDCEPLDLLDYYAERAAAEARESAARTVKAVLDGDARSVYYQWTRTFDELQAERADRHGSAPWPPEAAQ
jgi:hypothetical protein